MQVYQRLFQRVQNEGAMNSILYHVSFPKLGISLNVNPICVSFSKISIRYYGITLALAFLLAIIYSLKRSKEFNIDKERLMTVVSYALVAGIIGARLFYVIFYPSDYYFINPWKILCINEGGLGIYGGLILAILVSVLLAKINKIKVLSLLDLASLGILIGQSIGRWGNFFNQEAYGNNTDFILGMVSEGTGGVPVHPCFLYESLWCALGFIILHIVSKRFRKYEGQIFLMYLSWYGFGRFFIESLRQDSLIIPYVGLKVSQVISILIFVVSALILLLKFNDKRFNFLKSE